MVQQKTYVDFKKFWRAQARKLLRSVNDRVTAKGFSRGNFTTISQRWAPTIFSAGIGHGNDDRITVDIISTTKSLALRNQFQKLVYDWNWKFTQLEGPSGFWPGKRNSFSAPFASNFPVGSILVYLLFSGETPAATTTGGKFSARSTASQMV